MKEKVVDRHPEEIETSVSTEECCVLKIWKKETDWKFQGIRK
jgi:hypothetical protein